MIQLTMSGVLESPAGGGTCCPYGKIYKVTPTSFEPEYLIEVDPEFPADGVCEPSRV